MLTRDIVFNDFVNEFSSKIYNLKSDKPFTDYIFLCVGSDKITGDAFGPIVGENLKKLFKNFYNNIKVVVNLEKEVNNIINLYENPCIIAIDAALSKTENIGKIVVSNSKTKFGRGTNKKMIEVGDISIKGIVAKDHNMPRCNYQELQNTSLNIVMNLADITAEGIYNVIKYRQ